MNCVMDRFALRALAIQFAEQSEKSRLTESWRQNPQFIDFCAPFSPVQACFLINKARGENHLSLQTVEKPLEEFTLQEVFC